MSTELRALTVKHPWAACIASGEKTVENRTWGTRYRGLVAIHAAATADQSAYADRAMEFRIDDATNSLPNRYFAASRILAVAELADCHKSNYCCGPWAEEDIKVWHWVLKDIRQLQPIPAKGRLGLWTPDADLAAQIRAQLEVD